MTKHTTPSISPTPGPSSVYRFYDKHDVLLYVGFTTRGMVRGIEHALSKEWWPLVARQEIDHYENDTLGLEAERRLIVEFNPPFNKQHNPSHEQIRAAYMRLIDARNQSTPQNPRAFQDAYQALGHKLPLMVVKENSCSNALTLISREEDSMVALASWIGKPVTIKSAGAGRNGKSFGHIKASTHVGPYLILRGLVKDTAVELVNPCAELVVVTLKKPPSVRIRYISTDVDSSETSPHTESLPPTSTSPSFTVVPASVHMTR